MTTTRTARRLRDLAEPIASMVYFVPEAHDGYKALGLDDFGSGYFGSRGACLGKPSAEVVTAAFGVFNPAIVKPSVEKAWAATTPEALLEAREKGATAALHRMIGEADPSAAVGILRPAMESVPCFGRPLFSGLLSLPFPDDPFGQLWRACDYIRERRGDNHIAAWISAGCDAVDIGLLTEQYWGMEHATYIRTRGWSQADIDAGAQRMRDSGYFDGTTLTDAGREFRREIEATTDWMDQDVVDALGESVDELCELLEPWTMAVLEAKGYPRNPADFMNQR
jgi:hypothetical protein